MKVRFTLGIGFVGGEHSEVFDYDDDVSEETLQTDWQEWIWNYIDGSQERLDDGEEE